MKFEDAMKHLREGKIIATKDDTSQQLWKGEVKEVENSLEVPLECLLLSEWVVFEVKDAV